MSKVIVLHAAVKEPIGVSAATIATGWQPGQAFKLDSTGLLAQLAVTDETMFVGIDDDDEVSAPPSGSLLTAIYGAGTKFIIDHSEEVAAGSSTYAYTGTSATFTPNKDVYVDGGGKWTYTSTGSVKAKVFQTPSAANNFGLGLVLRF